MTKNLESTTRAAWVATGNGSLDSWAEMKLRGSKVRVLGTSRWVTSGKLTTRQALTVVFVMNQGFNGMVVMVRDSKGQAYHVAMKDLRAV